LKNRIIIFKLVDGHKKRISGFLSVILILGMVLTVTLLTNNVPATAITSCTAGTFTDVTSSDGNTHILTFFAPETGDGTCTFEVPSNVFAVDYLVIAGGGGGASGGGGGGGFVTSWRTRNEADESVDVRQAPLSVNSGDQISITIGQGGQGGAAGNYRGSETGYTTLPGNGGNSVFGSVTAVGGGAGGHNEFYVSTDENISSDNLRNGTGQSGGSGGGAAFDQDNVALVSSSSQSTVVGASTHGNSGGSSQGSGGYRAGAGGGGAGGIGGAIRSCNNGDLEESLGCGGHGADGLLSDISNFSNSFLEYSCGGGGGVNSNFDWIIEGGGGDAGCDTAGKGSSYGNYLTNYEVSEESTAANATSGSASHGGGGGGTDPEDTRGGAGGSGVVILRYQVNDANCPNNASRSQSPLPLACQASVTVVAGGSSQTVNAATSPISYPNPNSTTTLALVTTVNGMNLEVVNNAVVVSVTSSTSSLIGGTYPVTYSLTDLNSGYSENYILVTVSDPGQHTPVVIPVDPRVTSIDLPSIIVGNVQSVLMCVIPRNNSGGYTNQLTVTLTNGATSTSLTGGGIRFTGTNEEITTNAAALRVTADTGVIVAGPNDRILDVNVSNSATGGNGTCNGGTQSSITLRPLGLEQTVRKGNIQLKN
jgi:hypothetical protein